MTRTALPQIEAFDPPAGFRPALADTAERRWQARGPATPAPSADNTVLIVGPIGAYYEDGVGVRRIAAALRSIGADTDVRVVLHSPGGDVFEGVAIYNALRSHRGGVSVEVHGLAASAASLIAMAGDTVSVLPGAALMLHNSWGLVIGDRRALLAAAEVQGKVDAQLAALYAARSGLPVDEIASIMDAETWFTGAEAVAAGFADAATDEQPIAAAVRLASAPQVSPVRIVADLPRKGALPMAADNPDPTPAVPAAEAVATFSTQTAPVNALDRVRAVSRAEGIRGHGGRHEAAVELATMAPDIPADDIVAFITEHVPAADAAPAVSAASLAARAREADLADAAYQAPAPAPSGNGRAAPVDLAARMRTTIAKGTTT